MADYNVNMKQWNGTSFDNVLPLAYNAKNAEALAGNSLGDIQQWVKDNGLWLYTGQYTGDGTYGKSNPVSIQFPFEPKLFIFPISTYHDYPASSPLDTSFLTTSYKQVGRVLYSRSSVVEGTTLMARFSDSSRKKLQIYSTEDAVKQSNRSGEIYYFAAIGGYDMGGVGTEWIITSSGTWIVPRTGRYYIELYGMGGSGSYYYSNFASGGSSCQSYNNVQMTKGSSIAVVIGSNSSSKTSFGSKSVDNAGNATNETTPGKGTGNLGADGVASSRGNYVIKYGAGVLSKSYGFGGGETGGPGAVYIKYLGD